MNLNRLCNLELVYKLAEIQLVQNSQKSNLFGVVHTPLKGGVQTPGRFR